MSRAWDTKDRSRMEQQIKIIGVGGVGCALLPHLCRFLTYSGLNSRLYLIDGDDFEWRNLERQSFSRLGNKAEVKAEEMARRFDTISIRAVAEFVSIENVKELVGEKDVVFLAVDNHSTRKLLSEHCESLDDITLISGGNDLTDGNVQVFLRREGVQSTNPLTRFHPEIRDPGDENPADMSCEELAREGEPQLLFANLMVATLMLGAYYAILEGKLDYEEAYFDIVSGKVRTVKRGLGGGRDGPES